MDIQNFSALFNTPARREAFLKLIKDNKTKHIFIQGLEGSSIALFFSNLLEHKQAHIIIANDLDEAGYLYNDLVQINGNDHILLFPSGYKRDIKYGQPDPPSEILRTEVLNRLCQKGESLLIVTYPEAIAEKVVPVNMLSEQTLHIDKNSKCDIITLSDKLRERGFEEVDYVYEPGQFAVRGSILDVFSYTNELPYRIDFFGKEVESIRTFEVETQLSTGKLEEVYIVANVCGQEASGISILDFIDKNTILICHNLSWVIDRISTIASESLSEQTLIAEEGDRYAMQKIIDVTAFQKKITTFRRIDYGTSSEANAPAVIRFNCTPQGVYHKNFDLVSQSFSQFIEKGYTLYILSDSEKQIERLQAIFEERGDSISFTPVLKTLHEGFVDNDLKIGCFTDHQIFDRFHKYTLKSEHARSGKLALSLKELNQIEVGDYIVHVDHGIGRFGGLIHTEINGKMQEVIKLTYQNDDIIFVSIHALHKLAKYRAKEGEAPRINKLGSGAWERMKEKTKGKMKEIARDLIKLYAARKEEKGFAFSPDSFLQQELEASFIYEDTPDQIKSTAEVKADMERERPMDRLICGGLRENRNCHTCGIQSHLRQQTGSSTRAYHRIGLPALPNLQRAIKGVSGTYRIPQPSPESLRSKSHFERPRRPQNRYYHRNPQAHRERCEIQRPRAFDCRRGTKIRSGRKRETQTDESECRHPYDVGNSHTSHLTILFNGCTRPFGYLYPSGQSLSYPNRSTRFQRRHYQRSD